MQGLEPRQLPNLLGDHEWAQEVEPLYLANEAEVEDAEPEESTRP